MNTSEIIALQYACNTLSMELAEMAGYIVATLPDDLEKGVFFQQKMDYINTLKTRVVAMCGGVMPLGEDTSSLECDTSSLECDTSSLECDTSSLECGTTPADASTSDPS